MEETHATPELSSWQQGCIGALVGSIEQALMRPAVFWKAQLQQDCFVLSRALNPKFCYRGLPVAAASIAPISCIQFSMTNAAANTMQRFRGHDRPTSDLDRLVAGVFAGVASSAVQSPFQLVEINQQNHGGSMAATARQVVAAHGFRGLYRGGSMTAVREGIFCSSYIAVAPCMKRALMQRRPETSEAAALAASSFLSGGLGALLSHPADTLKTRLQGSVFASRGGGARALQLPRASGPKEALEEMRRSGNLVSQCYRGFAPRFFRIVCCTFIYSNLTESFERFVREWTTDASFKPLRLDFVYRPVAGSLGAAITTGNA